MATKKKDIPMTIKPKTPEMERLLATGYGMTIEQAKAHKKAYDEGATHLVDKAEKADAMLQAYEAKPQVISEREPWQRSRV
jgi:hypothetical protein